MRHRMITIGVIGVGRWGPNILRNFAGMEGVATLINLPN